METNNKKNFVMPAVIAVIIILIVGMGYLASRESAPAGSVQNATTTTSTVPVKVTTTVPVKPVVTSPLAGTQAKPLPATNISTAGKSSIEVLSPDGGDGFAIDTLNINASIPVVLEIANVKGISLYLIDALGKSVASVGISDATQNESTFVFRVNKQKTVNVIKTGDYKIKACDIKGTLCDTSEKSFRITSITTAAPGIVLNSPNGNETWKIGSKQTINFTASGNIQPEHKVIITLEPKAGPIVTVSATSSSYLWTIPKTICWGGDACGNLSPGYYKIKAALYDGEGKLITLDESDMNINIIN